MLGVLLAKDFRRVWRNPWPWVLNLSLPIAITALFGLAFGGGGKEPGIARIKVAIVDEDEQFLGSLFRSALSQGEAAKRFEVTHPARAEALERIRENRLSAAIIVPTNFTADFLAGSKNVALEVIKNPAERVFPAIVEELVAVAATGLNAVHRNLNSEFPRFQAAFTNEFDLVKLGELTTELGNRVKNSRAYLSPPLVQYRNAVIEKKKQDEGPGMSIFAFILPGMASAFLLFLADHSMRDVHRETRLRTLDRLRGIRASVAEFVAAKVLFAALSVLLGSVILFAGGGLVFGIDWGSPALLALACAGYAIFCAGFMAMLVTIVANERKAETVNNMLLFAIAFAGGSYFPANQMPAFLRDNVCPFFPNYWFIEAVRGFQDHPEISGPLLVVLKLSLAGLAMAVLASWRLQKRLTAGTR